jgi:hypothetical protein
LVLAFSRLFVYIVFTRQECVETSILEILFQIVDDVDKSFAVDYIPDVTPRSIDTVIRNSILNTHQSRPLL